MSLDLRGQGDRPDLGARGRRRRAVRGPCAVSLADELVVDGGVHVDALGADAGLAGVGQAAPDGAVDRRVDVGVRVDDQRVLATALGDERGQRARRTSAITFFAVAVEPVKAILSTPERHRAPRRSRRHR